MASKATVRWTVVAALAVVSAATLAYLFRPVPVDATTAPITRGPIAETVSDQGVARVRQSYVIAAPVAGRLERVELEVGDRATAGRTIAARLRPTSAGFLDPRARAQVEAQIAAARAAVTAAEADRDRLSTEAARTATDLARTTALVASGAAAQQQLDDARAAAKTARKAVEAAMATVKMREADLTSAESALTGPSAAGTQSLAIVSPASGVVTHVVQQSERIIAAGTPLVEIGDTSGLEAQIEFLSQDAVRIQPGQEAEIYDWGGPGVIPAQVRRVEPQAFTKVSALGVEEQRVLVMLQFTGPPESWSGLAPGYRVWGRVYLRREPSVVTAPVGALLRHAGGWAVFVVQSGRAHLRAVSVGAVTDRVAEILGGVVPGDQVVVFPSDQIADGVRVRAHP